MTPAVVQTRAAGAAAVAFVASVVVSLVLFAFGVVGEVGFWRLVAFACLGILFGILAAYARLLGEIDGWAELATKQDEILRNVRAIPTVRCAGCRVAAVLHGRPAEGPEGPEVPLPPGWGMRDERAYCAACLARAEGVTHGG